MLLSLLGFGLKEKPQNEVLRLQNRISSKYGDNPGRICHRRRFNNGFLLFHVIFKKSSNLKGAMNIKEAYEATNALGRASESRDSYPSLSALNRHQETSKSLKSRAS
jgi:hypothetical protein